MLSLAVDVEGTRIESVDGTVLSHTPGKRADRTSHLGPSSTVLWHALRDELATAAREAGARIELGWALQSVAWGEEEGQEEGALLTFTTRDGETATLSPSLAIGADGASSAFRAAMLPDDPPPEYAGTAVWRGATPTPPGWDTTLAGWRLLRGARAFMIAYSRARPDHVVWQIFYSSWPEERVSELASVAHMSGDRRVGATATDCLQRALSVMEPDWPDDLKELVAAADPASVAEHPLLCRRPEVCRTWTRGAAALLGDAAHLSTPVLGQGTSAAFEDALALGRAVGVHGACAAAAATYVAARVERASAIQAMSVELYGKQTRGEPFDEIGEHLKAGWMDIYFAAL